MTDGLTLKGMRNLAAKKVVVVIAGLDCGNFDVDAHGSVFVPFQSDPDGLLNPLYLNSISSPLSTDPAICKFTITNGGGDTITVYVPVLVGYAYTSAGQLMRPLLESQVKSPQGASIGKKRRIFNFAALLTNAQGLSFGSSQANLQAALFRDGKDTQLPKVSLVNGVYWGSTTDSDSYDGQLAWSITRPYPCTINALTPYLETADG